MPGVEVDPFKLYEWVSGAGFPALLAFLIYTSYKGVWVWGSVHREVVKEKDEWKNFALNATNLGTKAVTLAVKNSPSTAGELGR